MFDPSQPGRPSTATVAVVKPSGASHIASSTAVVDSVDTTLSADVAQDATSISVASAAGIQAGRFYVLTSVDGPHLWIRVESVDGTTVTLFDPLPRAFETGDTFVGNRITVAIGAGDATPLDEGYEAQLSWTIDGTTYYENVPFDIVRSPWPDVILAPHQFAREVPGLSGSWLERASASGLQFVDEIANATERVREDIVNAGLRPDLFRSHEKFRRPVALRVVLQWAQDGINVPELHQDTPQDWIDEREAQYSKALSTAMDTSRRYDADDSGAVTDNERTRRLSARPVILG